MKLGRFDSGLTEPPYCNIVGEKNMALPVTGPLPVEWWARHCWSAPRDIKPASLFVTETLGQKIAVQDLL